MFSVHLHHKLCKFVVIFKLEAEMLPGDMCMYAAQIRLCDNALYSQRSAASCSPSRSLIRTALYNAGKGATQLIIYLSIDCIESCVRCSGGSSSRSYESESRSVVDAMG